MLERVGDIFQQPDADAICFTSNGVVKQNGELVMGAGIAKAFRDRFPSIARDFGHDVTSNGNHVYRHRYALNKAMSKHIWVFSFPTKDDWRDKSSMELITQSASELLLETSNSAMAWNRVYLTRPGCGLGGLAWSDVKEAIAGILDDRFTILVPQG